MYKAIYPGSFDPVTNGHLDIIRRSANLVDSLVVAVLENPNKKSLFSVEERIKQLELVTECMPKVKVASFGGLLTDFALETGANVIIRGLRAVTDFEYEFQRALINRNLAPGIETIFISANEKHLFLSSSAVKEVAMFGGNIDDMVPKEVRQLLIEKYKK